MDVLSNNLAVPYLEISCCQLDSVGKCDETDNLDYHFQKIHRQILFRNLNARNLC